MNTWLAQWYGISLFQRHDIQHPIVFFEASSEQRDQVDSVLGVPPQQMIAPESFAFYNYGHLHSLQNSGRRLYNGRTYAYRRLRQRPLRIEADYGQYFDMIATCGALEQEMKAAAQLSAIRTPMRAQFHREIPPNQALSSGVGRSAAIGGAVLVVFHDGEQYRAILSRRTGSHATDPQALHILPAFIFQPVSEVDTPAEWSIERHIYREWLEELFGMDEAHGNQFDDHPALLDLQRMMQQGQASLHLTGIAFSLLSLRPEICALLLIRDPDWWRRVHAENSPYRLNTEAEASGKLLLVPLGDDQSMLSALPPDYHLSMVPQAIGAFWQGIDLARELLAL
jgi:hypothetical protein